MPFKVLESQILSKIHEQNIPIDIKGANGYWSNGFDFLVIFVCKLYIADNKKEIHNDIKLDSIPSHIELIEDNFISPKPKELMFNNLKLT